MTDKSGGLGDPAHPSQQAPLPTIEKEQIGGGRRAPSPPPVQTPTRLWTTVKATVKDAGLIQGAQARRGQLLRAEGDPFRSAHSGASTATGPGDHLENSTGNSPFPPGCDSFFLFFFRHCDFSLIIHLRHTPSCRCKTSLLNFEASIRDCKSGTCGWLR